MLYIPFTSASPTTGIVLKAFSVFDLNFTYRGVARISAKYLARELSLPCAPLLVRRKQGRAQKELSLFERELNAESMFRIRGAKYISGKTVIVVDDLVASGILLAQAGLALKRAGAKNVLFSCIAALEKKTKDDSFAQDIDIFG